MDIIIKQENRKSHLSSGTGFIQMKKAYLKNWTELFRAHPASLGVWVFLTENMNRMNEVHIPQNTILGSLGISRATLYRAYQNLEERNFIARDHGVIYLNKDLVWRGVKPGTDVLARVSGPPKAPNQEHLPKSLRGSVL